MSFRPLLEEPKWDTKDNNLYFYKQQYYLQHNGIWVNNFTIKLCYSKLPTTAKEGDLALFNGEYYIYYDNIWVKQNTKPKEVKKKLSQSSCKNCGAPLNLNIPHCEYCGSWINNE